MTHVRNQGRPDKAAKRAAVSSVAGVHPRILQHIVFPAIEAALTPTPVGHVTSCVLLRLEDESIWMWRTQGALWSLDRVARLAEAIRAIPEVDRLHPDFSRRVASTLQIASLTRLAPNLEHADPEQWQSATIARAMTERGGRPAAKRIRDGNQPGAKVLERELLAAIDSALSGFVAAMDRLATQLATRAGHIDANLYNFLVGGARTKYRRQLVQTFPIFYEARSVLGGRARPTNGSDRGFASLARSNLIRYAD